MQHKYVYILQLSYFSGEHLVTQAITFAQAFKKSY